MQVYKKLNPAFKDLYDGADMLSLKGGSSMSQQSCLVYIRLTRSGTWFSSLIHWVTAERYTHAAIGLDGPQGPFYSFARKDPRFALPAGLVEEGAVARGVPGCLYELEVSPQVYHRLREMVESMYRHREEFHYNLAGVLACWFHCPLHRSRHYFCSQFVACLLEESGAVELGKSPDLVRPADFCTLSRLRPVAAVG